MGSLDPILLFAVGAAAVIRIAWVRYQRVRRRRRELFSFAANHAFRYSSDDLFDPPT